ncbi:sensor histidine kinase [Paenibacillus sp. LHD-117]|uniref:cache domain-containing sensor histidine kinase n=1 Tax=Paenibacillus sp. LHD-117 TaxID=3071412 RepID=UPI0027DFA06B|nr:sensor histidine kinase [Paenibacillus sp. LHD-117]MDQ6418901.1 sensor histidine kinase [Paenibacillus sp. LHD-117]
MRWFPGLYRLLRNTKIKSRLIVALLLLTTVPIVLSGIYSYMKASEAIGSKITTYSAEIMKQLLKNAQLENKKYIGLSDSIMLNARVQQFAKDYASLDEFAKRDMSVYINTLLSDKLELLQNIRNVRIMATDATVIYDMGYNSIGESAFARLKELIDEADGSDQWSYLTTEQGEPCLVIARKINSLDDWNNPLGYIFVSISESLYSQQLYADIDMGEGTDVFILDGEGTVVSSRNPDIAMHEPYADAQLMPLIRQHEAASERAFMAESEGSRQLIAYGYDIYSDWYLVSTIPDRYLSHETRYIQRNILWLCGVLVIVSLSLALLISNSIYRPLTALVEQTSRIIRGNLNTSIDDRSKDEIGYLSDKFNVMVDKINALIEQTKTEQRQKREIELQMLQAQINPHFLFNTLNSLKWTAQLSQAESVSVGLSALAELLRGTIVDKKEYVTIKEELRYIDNYVEIQKIRYGSTFDVSIETEDEAGGCLAPKFILQPIVENAIIHGQEGISHNLLIRIRCRLEGDTLQITIEDNGKGMGQDTVNKLLQGRGKSSSDGRLSNIGISNVDERIRYSFGNEYGLRIESEPAVGTTVTLTMPKVVAEGAGDPPGLA